MDIEAEVKRLAALARLEVPEGEVAGFAKEFEQVLAYVSKLNELSIDVSLRAGSGQEVNVFREDANPHEAGAFTEAIVAQFPNREGNLLSVKKILP